MRRQPGKRAPCGTWLGQDRWHTWARALGVGMVLACAYFLAARLGLALLSESEDIPAFWPAAGVAAGALIVLKRRARAAVVVGVLAVMVAVDLLGGRTIWAALSFGLCSAGEALLTAWLVDRWCGRPLKFDDCSWLWGFLAAAAVASTAAAFGAAVAMQQLNAAVPFYETWRVWAAADGLGIAIVAPVLVGLYHLAAGPMPRVEAFEGTAALGLLAGTASTVYGSSPATLLSEVPPAVLFPFLLWIAARCRPVFAAAAGLVIAATLVGATTFRSGSFANGVAIPTAQVSMLIGSLCALTLAALFAERRSSEGALQRSNERLRLALSGVELGVWSVDLTTGAFENDEGDCRVNGHDPAAPPWPRPGGRCTPTICRASMRPLRRRAGPAPRAGPSTGCGPRTPSLGAPAGSPWKAAWCVTPRAGRCVSWG
jgi:hypothetical protein